jgi:hypothetical protein
MLTPYEYQADSYVEIDNLYEQIYKFALTIECSRIFSSEMNSTISSLGHLLR